MIQYVLAFLMSRHKLTKHLLRKQKEINELREEIARLEADRKQTNEAFRTIHKILKERVGDFYWF